MSFTTMRVACVGCEERVSLSGEEYVLAVTAFIKSLELDLTGSQALRLSYSITSISTTLTEEQVVCQSTLPTVSFLR